MALKVKVTGVDEAVNALESYLRRKKLALLGVVAETTHAITNEAKVLAPKDLGDLRAGIIPTVMEKKNNIIGTVLSSMEYSAYVEFGTKPHRPPYKALEGWSERHGIPVGAVVAKIAREGTPAQPYMTPAVMKEKGPFARNVALVMSKP